MAPGGGDDAEERGARRVARWIVGALGVAGALVAFAALPLPWYTLKSGPTFTGLDLLRADQFAYSAGYIPEYTPSPDDPALCMTGVAHGFSLPIGIALAACVALLLVALVATLRAPRGWWGRAGALVWVVGGWMALFFLFPWITALVNVDPNRVHGHIMEFTVETFCRFPGGPDYGQTVFQLGLLLACVAGLAYGLLYRPAASRLAQVGAVGVIAAYLMPANLSPLRFLATSISLNINLWTNLIALGPILLPPVFALLALALAWAYRRRGTPGVRRWLVVVCLVGALVGALAPALLTFSPYLFDPENVIIGPGVTVSFLSDTLLVVASILLPADAWRARHA